MREKIGEKLLITLALAVLLSELLNVCVSVYGSTPIIKGIAMFASILFVIWLWSYFVIAKDKKKYEKRKETVKRVVENIEFDNIYNELKQEHRDYLESKRKAPRNRYGVRYICLAIIGVCATMGVFYILCGQAELAVDLIQIILLVSVALAGTFLGNDKDIMEYKAAYKLRIINSLVNHINPKLEYSDPFLNPKHILDEYETANFGLLEHNVYECIDKIEGNTEVGYLELAELNLGYNTIMENGKTRYVNVFKGFFGRIELGVDEWFKLKISSVGVKSRAGILEVGTDKIKLDSKEFMDNFVVQTNDKMLAMRILTSEILTELFDYRDAYGLALDVSIKNGNIYFLFYTGDILEPDEMKDSMNKDVMLKDYATIKIITDLMQKMSAVVKEVQSE